MQEGKARLGRDSEKKECVDLERLWRKSEFSNPFITNSKKWKAVSQSEVLNLGGWELGSAWWCFVPVKFGVLAKHPCRIVAGT